MKNILKSYNIFTIVFAVVVILTVVCTPLYGLGDLSEYMSVFENVGLYNSSADSSCITQSYGISDNAKGTVNFFENFLSGIISVNKTLYSDSVFNIHFLSSIYVIVFLLSMYFLQKNVRFEKDILNYVFSALLAVVFLDLGYLAYFNSFYSEALLFVLIIALCATAVSAIRKFSYLKLALLAVGVCAFSFVKISAAVVAFCFGVLVAVLTFCAKDKKRVGGFVLSLVVMAVSVFSVFNTQICARDVKLYNLLYNDLAHNTDTDLSVLNIKLIDIPAENMNSDAIKQAVDGTTYGDVVKYYVSNPSVFYKGIKTAANNAYFLILDFAQYKEAGADYGIRDAFVFKVWNYLKRRVLPVGVAVIFAFIAIYFAVAVCEFLKYKKSDDKKRSALALVSTLLPVGALSEIVTTVLTTGQILVSKNMFVFGVYFDLMLVTAIIWASATLLARREAITKKYGVNQ